MKLLADIEASLEPARERAPMLARLGLTDRAIDPRDVIYEPTKRFNKFAVENSEDLKRIVDLPRRPRPSIEEQTEMARVMTASLRLERTTPCACSTLSKEPCITTLLPVQGWYLFEAAQCNGALGHIVVGGGKTGIDILLAMAVPDVKRAVLLIPPNLRKQFALDYKRWAQHFRVPNLAGGNGPFWDNRPVLDVLAYSELSHESAATWLKGKPDINLVITDEAQNLKDKDSVRTSRFLRFFIESSADPRLCAHSGSLTVRSPDDYGHLAALSLGNASPVPIDVHALGQWCQAIAPGRGQVAAPMGALKVLCEVGETVRSGFHRRLTETKGVVTTADAELPTGLTITTRHVEVPEVIAEQLTFVRERNKRPDGEELVEALEVATVCSQLACGFFYRWKYPRGEPVELIEEWFAKRQSWNRELRAKLERRADNLDSPKLCKDAAVRYYGQYEGDRPTWPALSWPEWEEIDPKVRAEPDTVWVDDYLARDAVDWGRKNVGIIWYLHSAFGRKVAELGGYQFFGGGDEASERIAQEDGSRTIVASIKAHGTGKNLQAWSRMLVANSPADGGSWEQLIGRLHRKHQKADAVEVFVYQHTDEFREALARARDDAEYVAQTTGSGQKLLYATWNE